MISSTISLASFLSQRTDPQKPKSFLSISAIESTIFAPVAEAEFSISEESSSPMARILLSARLCKISRSISPPHRTKDAPLSTNDCEILFFLSCSASTNASN